MRPSAAPPVSFVQLPSGWSRAARSYVGDHHPLVAVLLAMAALLKLWVAAGMLLGDQRDRPGYAPVLILAILVFLFSAWAAALEIRKLLLPVGSTQHDRLVVGVPFVARAKELLDAREAGKVRGIDMWRALSLQLAHQRANPAIMGERLL